MSKLACGETYHILLQCRAEKTGLGGEGERGHVRYMQTPLQVPTAHTTARYAAQYCNTGKRKGGGQRRTIYHVFLFPPSGVNNTLPDANGKKQIRLEGSRAMHDWR